MAGERSASTRGPMAPARSSDGTTAEQLREAHTERHRDALSATDLSAGEARASLELSRAQVDGVMRELSGGGAALTVLMGRLGGVSARFERPPAELADRRMSQSFGLGLRVLACFPIDQAYLSNTEVAAKCDMNMSTAHRYISTLVAVGLLEREPKSRRYRIAWRGVESEAGALSRNAEAPAEPGAGVVITLSREQAKQVVRDAAGSGAMSILFCGREEIREILEAEEEMFEDSRLSQSLIQGLLIFVMFPLDGGYLGVTELAGLLAANPSTTHRYLMTLLSLGLLERDRKTRRYRLAL